MPILQGLVLCFGVITAQIIAHTIIPHGMFGGEAAQVLRSLVAIMLSIGVYIVAVRFVAQRPATDFDKRGWAGELAVGILLGAIIMSIVVAVAWALGAYEVVGINPNRLIVTSGAQAALAGVVEEIAFRAGLLRLIEHRLGTWWALVLTSALFGAAHLANPEADWWGAIAIALEAGVLLGACYIVTRRLWLVMGVHAAWNFMQGGIFSSDVSGNGLENTGLLSARIEGPWWLTGGDMGFEGSVTAVLLCLSVAVVLLVAARARGLIVPRNAFRFEVVGPCGPMEDQLGEQPTESKRTHTDAADETTSR